MSNRVVFSGVKPTGIPTLGNYLGAMRNFPEMQHQAQCYFCVVDLHALTVPQNPSELRKQTLDVARLFVACGLDPAVSTLFVQSQLPAHAELSWLLECLTYTGELRRMTQFKDKSKKNETVSTGLLTYPVLMAADVLLYDTTHVPVGEDQKQHVELCRDIAHRFNGRFGETFVLPEPFIPAKKTGGRIMSLSDPTKKMAKSEDDGYSYILLTDTADQIRAKVRRAVTDPGSEVKYDEKNKPGVSNLMVILSLCSGMTLDEISSTCSGYGQLKREVTDAIVAKLAPIQRRLAELSEPGVVENILDAGLQQAEVVANKKLAVVKQKIGLHMRLPAM